MPAFANTSTLAAIMQHLLKVILIFLFSACQTEVNLDSIDVRDDGIAYVKKSNIRVVGKVTKRFADGRVEAVGRYEDGLPIGEWIYYGHQGDVIQRVVSSKMTKYQSLLNNADLSSSVISICSKDEYRVAVISLFNDIVFRDSMQLLSLARTVYAEYGSNKPLQEIIALNNSREYTFEESILRYDHIVFDTFPGKKKIFVRMYGTSLK